MGLSQFSQDFAACLVFLGFRRIQVVQLFIIQELTGSRSCCYRRTINKQHSAMQQTFQHPIMFYFPYTATNPYRELPRFRIMFAFYLFRVTFNVMYWNKCVIVDL